MIKPRSRILTWGELRSLPPTSYLINRIIPERGLAYLVAPPSSKKTFVAVEIAACVATGYHFFGTPTRRGNVVYLAAEGSSGLRKRFLAWSKNRGLAIEEEFLGIIPEPVLLNNPIALRELIDELKAHAAKVSGVSLIIIDTVNRTLEGDENSARDMSLFVQGCSSLISELGTSILLLHHPSKSGSVAARGHSSLHGAADIGFEIRNGGSATFTLQFDTKSPKDDEPHEAFLVSTKVVDLSDELGFEKGGAPITSLALERHRRQFVKVEETNSQTSSIAKAKQLIRSVLGNSALSRYEIIDAMKAHGFEGTDRTIDRALTNMRGTGEVTSPARGFYELTENEFDNTDSTGCRIV